MIALSAITDAVLHEDLIPGATPDTFALIVGRDNGRVKIFTMNDKGIVGFRYLDDPAMKMPAAWESGHKLRNGTILAFRTNEHVKLFWLIEGL